MHGGLGVRVEWLGKVINSNTFTVDLQSPTAPFPEVNRITQKPERKAERK